MSVHAPDHRKHSVFIGRWQPFHKGHRWLIEQADPPYLILIRDTPPDEDNPLTTEQTAEILKAGLSDLDAKVMRIPDVRGVYYGRGVGYDVEKIEPNPEIAAISATETRKMLREGDDGWRECVPDRAEDKIEEHLG